MSLCTVAELKSVLGVGSLYSDATIQEVCDAADAVLLPMLAVKTAFPIAHSKTGTTAKLYFDEEQQFIVGDSVVVANCGSAWNGTKTLTAADTYVISYTVAAGATVEKNTIFPAGLVTGDITTDWTLDAAVQNAAVMVSTEIWQSRTATLSGSNLVDFQPSPYRMSAQLLAKVRGLIAHALDPRSMVG